jgi:hypothetical protein
MSCTKYFLLKKELCSMSNKWKKFLVNRRQKFTLEEFGLDEFWVEFVPITAYPRSVIKEISKDVALVERPDDEEISEEEQEQVFVIHKYCIVGWNLTDPDIEDEDRVMPLPKDDITVLDKLPTDILIWLSKRIGEVNEEANPPA